MNVDFADVKTVMSHMGRALMGTGVAKGQNRARLAAEMAVTSPLLDDISVEGATGVLINIVGGPDLKMREIQEAASLVQEQAHEDANIIFGASIDETLGENVKVTVIATGFDGEAQIAEQTRATAAVTQSLSSPLPRSAPQPAPASMRPSMEAPAPSRRPVPAQSGYPQSGYPQQPSGYPQSSHPRAAEEQRHAPSAHPSRPAARAASAAQDVFPSMDHDWDVPAFQRKPR